MSSDATKRFGERLLGFYTGAVLTKLIELGYRVGLFEGSRAGPATSAELADRLGLKERYVREWLGAMATSGIYSYDPVSGRYSLSDEHAALLTGDSAQNAAPMSRMINHFGTHLSKLTACFREGGGIPYSAYRPVFTQCMDDVWRRIFDQMLVSGFIGAVKGLPDQLRKGIRVLDIGCGTGHAMNVLAREFPNSTFTGYDIAEDAITQAREEASELALSNSTFNVVDVTDIPDDPKFNLITAFDAIHDQKAPDAVLRSCRFQEGDASDMKGVPDRSFDLVVTIFGAMFAPKPFDVAKEMVRVSRPGGRIVMGNWIPNDPTLVAQILKISSAFTPPPPDGFVSPMTWGVESNVTERFVAAGVPAGKVSFARDTFTFSFPGAPEDLVGRFKNYYGPTMNAFDAAQKSGRVADLQGQLEGLFKAQNKSSREDMTSIPATFLRVTVAL